MKPPHVRRRVIVRPRFGPVLEGLDDRCLLSVVTLGAATEADYRTVSVNYQVAAPGLNSLVVNVYRSTVAQLGAGNQVLVGSVTLGGSNVSAGEHDNVPLVLDQRASGVDALAIDPAHPYVIATATGPDGVATSASYRTIDIALVTHGFDSSDTAPAWIYQMASSLTALGYDDAIPFDWATDSHTLSSGEGVKDGIAAAGMIEQYINGTNAQGQPNVPSGAVVDLHIIGHSRGSVVITQAMQTLQDDLSKIPQAAGGYWELTYLDPHPSHGANVAPFSATSQKLIDVANLLQEIFQDPYPLTVPSHVALAQIYYENTPVSMIASLSEEGQLDPWGITNPTGIQAAQGASTQFEQRNLTTPGMSHSGVYQWYQANVVPTLGTAGPFVTGPLDAPIVANGYNLNADAGSFELQQPAYFSDLDPGLSAGDFTAQINWGDGTPPSSGSVFGFPDTGFIVAGFHTFLQAGTYPYTVTIDHPGGSSTTATGTVYVTAPTTLSGAQAGQPPLVTVARADNGQVQSQFLAFPPAFRGGVRVATADVNGDGTRDIIAATGPGAPAEVRVFDGKDHHLLSDVFPFGRRYRGGLAVSSGNVTPDGRADIVVGDASGRIKLYNGADGSILASLRARHTSFRKGTGLSLTDVDGDSLADVVVTRANGRARPVVLARTIIRQQAVNRLKQLRNPRFAVASASSDSLLSGLVGLLRPGRR